VGNDVCNGLCYLVLVNNTLFQIIMLHLIMNVVQLFSYSLLSPCILSYTCVIAALSERD